MENEAWSDTVTVNHGSAVTTVKEQHDRIFSHSRQAYGPSPGEFCMRFKTLQILFYGCQCRDIRSSLTMSGVVMPVKS